MRFPLAFEATASRAEFLRLLPAATGEAAIGEDANGLFGHGWRLRLTAMPVLAIGLVRLERHRVEIEFDGLTAEQQERFMQRFSLYFQRGGG